MRPSHLPLTLFALVASVTPTIAHLSNGQQLHPRHKDLAERTLMHQKRGPVEGTGETSTSSAGGLLGGLLGGDESSTSAKPSSTSELLPSSTSSTSSTISSDSLSVASSVIPSSTPSSTPSISVASATGTVPSTAGSVSGSSSGLNATSSLASSASSSGSISMANTSSTTSASAPPSSPAPASAQVSTSIFTDAAGVTSIVTLYQTAAATPSTTASSTAAAASTSSSSKNGDSISTPAIVGVSVAVGLVVISLIACAVWRMKRRGREEDEAIRWPELNRHGDTAALHALPARRTGQHGFETNVLERSISASSSLMSPTSHVPPHSATPMALNGSNFGASSVLDEEYDEKASYLHSPPASQHAHTHVVSYDEHEDYSSFPPPVQMQQTPSNLVGLAYDSDGDELSRSGHGRHGYGVE
ncbi:hypothetical protein P7C73_g5036, partial [Tremellales sp. Uapishka_1]